jgi:(1->4)-alpha-D-glucan 1-alpha-D-glucosylmutase
VADLAGTGRGRPVSTYRLQLREEFGFEQAAEQAGYLAALGVTHVYLSPILQANAGSPHGYDVVDHSLVSAALGGEEAFRAMAERFHRHHLGVVVDVVPNHMARPTPEWLNQQLWSVLYQGRQSPASNWFDIDWDAQEGKMLLPILGGPLEKCLGDLSIEPGLRAEGASGHRGPVLRYFDHVLPLRDGVADLPLGVLLSQQHYRLTDWRDAATQLNWRRFFDINELIAIRVEDPEVFEATHQVLLRLFGEGLIDGFRIDHPDGLADPAAYLTRLAAATGDAWVVVEKILARGEELPPWRCAGTTGYDTLNLINGLFVAPAGQAPLTQAYARFIEGAQSFAEVERIAKRYVVLELFTAELSRLIRVFGRAGYRSLADFGPADLHEILVALLASFPVYRAYVTPGEFPPQSAATVLSTAADSAREELAARLHPALDAVCAAVLGLDDPADPPAGQEQQDARDELVVRFGQVTGPAMAKGVEDTAFYRWSRLAALNEVGGDPGIFSTSPAEFHTVAGRLAARWPATMTTLSTHDTKRQEDVRARLAVLAEWPEEWAHQVTEWHGIARWLTDGATARATQRAPEPDLEYLMWQTLVGAWLIGQDRQAEYLSKAMREAKTRTSWLDPDSGYESAVLGMAAAVLNDAELVAGVAGFVARIAPDARVNSLGAKLIQLTMPGVADTYQGCELAGLSLVDPDNRRPVDYQRRARLLAALRADPDAAVGLDAEKLLVTTRALWLRRDHPDWFAGSYTPLTSEGPAADHAIAFARGGHAVTVVTRLPAGLRRRGGWADTELPLPELHWYDVLTGVRHAGLRPPLAELTRRLPVALLVPERVYLAGQLSTS